MSKSNGSAVKGVGAIVTWQTRGVFARRDDVVDALKRRGIEVSVKTAEPATFVRRAINECIEDGLVRKVGEDEKKVCFAVVRERGDLELGKWDGRMQESVTLFKGSGNVKFTKGGDLAKRIEAAMAGQRGALLGREVAESFQRVMCRDADAVKLRPGGGVLFVPAEKFATLDALDAVIDELQSLRGFTLNRFDVAGGSRTLRDVYKMLRVEVDREFERVRAYVARAIESEKTTPNYYRTREREVVRMIQRIERLRRVLGHDMRAESGRLKMYRVFLSQRYAKERARRDEEIASKKRDKSYARASRSSAR